VQNSSKATSEHENASLVMKRIAELEQKIEQTTPIRAPPLLRGATVRVPRPSLQPRIPFQFTRLMQSERKQQPLAAATQSYGCWGCGATNHILRQCPVIPEEEKRRFVPMTPGPYPRANPIWHPTLPQHACITVTSGERSASALIDTGSDVTLVGLILTEQLGWDIRPTFLQRIIAANGDKMSILGICFVKLGVGSRLLKTRVFVTTRIQQIILGSDWLAERRCVTWDFVLARVRFGTRGEWIPLQRESNRPPVVSMLRCENFTQTQRSATVTQEVQTEFWLPTQRLDSRPVLAQIETCHPVYFQRDAAHQMISIRILEHSKVDSSQLQTYLVDGNSPLTEIAQECARTGERSRSQAGLLAHMASQCNEPEGACGETSCRDPLGASVTSDQSTPTVVSSVPDNLEGSSTRSLQDTSNIALNMFAKLAVSPINGNSRIQYWQGRGSSRVELFASEKWKSRLPVPTGVRSNSNSDPASSAFSAEQRTACEKPLLEERQTLGVDSVSMFAQRSNRGRARRGHK